MAIQNSDPAYPSRSDDLDVLSPIEDVIEDARNGRMFILIDDEDRENEGADAGELEGAHSQAQYAAPY